MRRSAGLSIWALRRYAWRVDVKFRAILLCNANKVDQKRATFYFFRERVGVIHLCCDGILTGDIRNRLLIREPVLQQSGGRGACVGLRRIFPDEYRSDL